jgi:gluconate kinase
MAAATAFDRTKYTRIVFGGVPGCGKSTLSVAFAKKLQDTLAAKNVDCLVLLNHHPVNENAGEVVLDDGNRFMQHIYSPRIKEKYLSEAMTISARLMARELETIKQFVLPGSKQHVINVLERSFLCSISIFIPGAFNNMREASDVEGNHSEEWSDVRWAQQHMLAMGMAIDQFYEPSYTLIVYMSCSAALAHTRVQKRGRAFEATGLSLDYMQTLVDYHEKCFDGRGDDRVVSIPQLSSGFVLAIPAADCDADTGADDDDAIGRSIEPLVNIIKEALDFYVRIP